jgi:2-amino-4-hydroxy-6-hydroxymethyldihydropteridine diphosphokinase
MVKVYISVGSNIDPLENVRKGLKLLDESVKIVALSTFWMTDPVDSVGQPQFLNGVVEIETELEPSELKFSVLRKIEEKLGRVRTGDKHAPREIDLDIVIYDDVQTETEGMILPDPEIESRAFLAVPLYELDPDMVLPGTEKKMYEIAGKFVDHTMQPMDDYTKSLRDDLGL